MPVYFKSFLIVLLVGAVSSLRVLAAEDQVAAKAQRVAEYNELFLSPQRAAERGFVDAVIRPSQTRYELFRHLSLNLSKQGYRPARRNGNVPM